MNFIIADKDSAYVYTDFSEDPDYFTMKYKRTEDQIIIGSEQYDGDSKWQSIACGCPFVNVSMTL